MRSMEATERFAVSIGTLRVGTLRVRGDYSRFAFDESYLENPSRPILGLRFEQDLTAVHASALRLPVWFSNLLPEGKLRDWIARDRGVASEREMQLLARIGQDLPGAVRVIPDEHDEVADEWEVEPGQPAAAVGRTESAMRFSLAGVAMKFSMLARQDRLSLPGKDEVGDWIVKFPDRSYSSVPVNEHAMMTLAQAAGLDVPEHRLVHRDEVAGVPDSVWPAGEDVAYAVRRFDRTVSGDRIHIEDLAQVRGFYPDGHPDKYSGSYETAANHVYRRRDQGSLDEFVRRLAFCLVTGNHDAHLKNWSLIYRDPRRPTLAPAYDLVSTVVYIDTDEIALKLNGTKLASQVRLRDFASMA